MTAYPQPRRFGYKRPPGIVNEPPPWEALIRQGLAVADDPVDYLQGVWQSLQPVKGELPFTKGLSDLRERQELVRALLAESARDGSAA